MPTLRGSLLLPNIEGGPLLSKDEAHFYGNNIQMWLYKEAERFA